MLTYYHFADDGGKMDSLTNAGVQLTVTTVLACGFVCIFRVWFLYKFNSELVHIEGEKLLI